MELGSTAGGGSIGASRRPPSRLPPIQLRPTASLVSDASTGSGLIFVSQNLQAELKSEHHRDERRY